MRSPLGRSADCIEKQKIFIVARSSLDTSAFAGASADTRDERANASFGYCRASTKKPRRVTRLWNSFTMERDLPLAGFEPLLGLVDDVDTAFAPDDAAVAVTRL